MFVLCLVDRVGLVWMCLQTLQLACIRMNRGPTVNCIDSKYHTANRSSNALIMLRGQQTKITSWVGTFEDPKLFTSVLENRKICQLNTFLIKITHIVLLVELFLFIEGTRWSNFFLYPAEKKIGIFMRGDTISICFVQAVKSTESLECLSLLNVGIY